MTGEETDTLAYVEACIELAKRHKLRRLEVGAVGTFGGVVLELTDQALAGDAPKVAPPTEKERREAEERRKNLRRYGSSVG